ncbi:hypothetical protein M9H77_07515 [Catharanthus roseus]|uniref:Uncharacterized protein n=1 Tax=Catharanthus roseus TaxID=4058 RepID=A0ACC0BV48_CATRO|nr:hypothetical protein M9H77_07515 [Catharanthus roseus]
MSASLKNKAPKNKNKEKKRDRVEDKGRSMEKELGTNLEDLPISLSLNPSLMWHESLPSTSKCVSSYDPLKNQLVINDVTGVPSCFDCELVHDESFFDAKVVASWSLIVLHLMFFKKTTKGISWKRKKPRKRRTEPTGSVPTVHEKETKKNEEHSLPQAVGLAPTIHDRLTLLPSNSTPHEDPLSLQTPSATTTKVINKNIDLNQNT